MKFDKFDGGGWEEHMQLVLHVFFRFVSFCYDK